LFSHYSHSDWGEGEMESQCNTDFHFTEG
jgi:hypothetical protein